MGICSKFSVKCEASHKDIVKVDSLMLVTFKYIGRVGTNRKVVHLTITVCRKLHDKVYLGTNI